MPEGVTSPAAHAIHRQEGSENRQVPGIVLLVPSTRSTTCGSHSHVPGCPRGFQLLVAVPPFRSTFNSGGLARRLQVSALNTETTALEMPTAASEPVPVTDAYVHLMALLLWLNCG